MTFPQPLIDQRLMLSPRNVYRGGSLATTHAAAYFSLALLSLHGVPPLVCPCEEVHLEAGFCIPFFASATGHIC